LNRLSEGRSAQGIEQAGGHEGGEDLLFHRDVGWGQARQGLNVPLTA
jgi:hypothetical protein